MTTTTIPHYFEVRNPHMRIEVTVRETNTKYVLRVGDRIVLSHREYMQTYWLLLTGRGHKFMGLDIVGCVGLTDADLLALHGQEPG